MPEEIAKNQESVTEQKDSPAVDYIEAIKEIKNNSVPKEEYQKLVADHKKLLENYLSGQPVKKESDAAPVDVGALRKKLFETDLTNLEYAQTMLELRSELIKKGEPDPFVPVGHKVTTDGSEYDKAERLADALQYCIDSADGDSSVFTAKFQGILKDTTPIKRR